MSEQLYGVCVSCDAFHLVPPAQVHVRPATYVFMQCFRLVHRHSLHCLSLRLLLLLSSSSSSYSSSSSSSPPSPSPSYSSSCSFSCSSSSSSWTSSPPTDLPPLPLLLLLPFQDLISLSSWFSWSSWSLNVAFRYKFNCLFYTHSIAGALEVIYMAELDVFVFISKLELVICCPDANLVSRACSSAETI